MGDGDNTFTHDGEIESNLFVTSKNESDTATVSDTAIVGGETTIALGEQRDFDRGRGPGHHHSFGGPNHGESGPAAPISDAAVTWKANASVSSAQSRGSRRR
jgi:hypothetical protein